MSKREIIEGFARACPEGRDRIGTRLATQFYARIQAEFERKLNEKIKENSCEFGKQPLFRDRIMGLWE